MFTNAPKGINAAAPVAHVMPFSDIPFSDIVIAKQVAVIPVTTNINPNKIFKNTEDVCVLFRCRRIKNKIAKGVIVIRNGISSVFMKVNVNNGLLLA